MRPSTTETGVRATALSCLALTCTCLASAGPPTAHSIPLAHFTLGETWDIIVVAAVCIGAIVLWLLTRWIPGWGTVLLTVVTLPIVEEFLFRYLLTGIWGLERGNVDTVAAFLGRCMRLVGRHAHVEALVFFGVFFGLAHMLLALGAWALDFTKAHAAAVFLSPPGLQVGEGLFIGLFNGCAFIIFHYQYGMGLLATMLWVWFAHILINGALVAYNLVVNFVLGGNIFAHIAPRFGLALTGVFWFVKCWVDNALPTDIFR